MKKLFAMMLALVMVLAAVPVLAEGKGDPSKQLTVSNDGEYKTVQAAIDYIKVQSDKSDWTITVKNGTYARFTVPSGLDRLTIEGESQSGVLVDVLKDKNRDSQWDNGGINVHSGNVTLKNMTVRAGSETVNWCDAAISTHHGANGGSGVSLTVENCTVIGDNTKYGIFWDCERVEVKNCTISGFSNAIEFMCDNYSIPNEQTYKMTGNIITGCSFAIHGYLGGGNGGGVLEISGNTISGTDALRAKVIAQQNARNTMKVKVSGNCMENAVIGLVNLRGEGEKLSDPLTDNTLGKNCFYVEAIEPGTIDFYSAYYAPGGDNGYWELTDIEDIDVDWGNNPNNSKAFIQKLVDEANAKGSHTLSITGIDKDNLIKTFTWFKDAIYWNSQEPEPTPTPDPWYPPYTPTPVQPVQPVQPAPLPPQTGDMPLWYAVAQFLGLVK